MRINEGRHLLLAGNPVKEDHGVWATVTREPASTALDPIAAWRKLGVEALLAAPLVRLTGEPGRRRIVVGTARVAVDTESRCSVALLVQAVWSERDGWHQEAGFHDGTDGTDDADHALIASLAAPAHQVTGEPESIAVTTVKAFAEGARETVAQLRDLRYEVERKVADLLAQRRSTLLRALLAEIVELSLAFSRARDRAREAVRDGLWIHLWDRGTYYLNRGEGMEAARPWTSTHRNALRHCEAVDVELADEVARLQALLSSMSTFAVAQEGEGQQRFNTLAAAAAAGLGVPALILSLYGADTFLPFSFDHAWRALLPIAATSLIAVTVTLRRMPGKTSARHFLTAIGLVAALVSVLLVAGLLAPHP
ncbi:hypothetical protein [Amycolatopsis sp.]|uniref:hypothetical protein n=1 Tax=Amycolatopsis sp. TaxID=37632 RepID=UPI0039C87482